MDLLNHIKHVASVIAGACCAVHAVITGVDHKPEVQLPLQQGSPEMQIPGSVKMTTDTLQENSTLDLGFPSDSLAQNESGEILSADSTSSNTLLFSRRHNPNFNASIHSYYGVGRWDPLSKNVLSPWESIKNLLAAISDDHIHLGIEDRNIKIRMASGLLFLELTIDTEVWCISDNDCKGCPFIYIESAQNKDLETRAEAVIRQMCTDFSSSQFGAKQPLCAVIARILSECSRQLLPFTATEIDGVNKALTALHAELAMAENSADVEALEGDPDEEDSDPPDQEAEEVSEWTTALLLRDAMAVSRLFPHVTVVGVRSQPPLA